MDHWDSQAVLYQQHKSVRYNQIEKSGHDNFKSTIFNKTEQSVVEDDLSRLRLDSSTFGNISTRRNSNGKTMSQSMDGGSPKYFNAHDDSFKINTYEKSPSILVAKRDTPILDFSEQKRLKTK